MLLGYTPRHDAKLPFSMVRNGEQVGINSSGTKQRGGEDGYPARVDLLCRSIGQVRHRDGPPPICAPRSPSMMIQSIL